MKKIIILSAVVIVALGGYFWYNNKGKVMPADKKIADEQAVAQAVKEKKQVEDFLAMKAVLDKTAQTDSDFDGLSNEQEKKYGTDPQNVDTDGDGLWDQSELMDYKIDPLNLDTDGDGFNDGEELSRGYNPLGPGKLK